MTDEQDFRREPEEPTDVVTCAVWWFYATPECQAAVYEAWNAHPATYGARPLATFPVDSDGNGSDVAWIWLVCQVEELHDLIEDLDRLMIQTPGAIGAMCWYLPVHRDSAADELEAQTHPHFPPPIDSGSTP